MNRLPPSATRGSSRPPSALAGSILAETVDTRQQRLDDWVSAFAAKLAGLGADAATSQLTRLGRSLYPHYDLLDPYQIARMVWRRWSAERASKAPDAAQAPRAKSGSPGVPGSDPC